MRQLLTTILLLFTAAAGFTAAARSDGHNDGTRVILKAAPTFDTVILNGNLTVEIAIDDRYAGYIVYYRDREDAPRLQCINSENTLLINGSAESAGICSRVTVVCSHDLVNVINNSAGRIVYPNATDKLTALNIINNASGDIGIRRSDIPSLNIINNGSGRIGIKKATSDSINIINNGSGKVFVGGKIKDAYYANNGSGLITANRAKAGRINACVNGSGDIRCRYADSLTAFVAGSGNILYYSRNGKPGKNVTAGGTSDDAVSRITPTKFKNK